MRCAGGRGLHSMQMASQCLHLSWHAPCMRLTAVKNQSRGRLLIVSSRMCGSWDQRGLTRAASAAAADPWTCRRHTTQVYVMPPAVSQGIRSGRGPLRVLCHVGLAFSSGYKLLLMKRSLRWGLLELLSRLLACRKHHHAAVPSDAAAPSGVVSASRP